MRKLASIQTISNIYPIKGADFIELATIQGWTLIVKKGEFKVGDLAVYFEIDSFLPLEDKYSFLEKSKKTYLGKEGYRIKTMKMKGVISQGLALPLSLFNLPNDIEIGTDISDLLNVIKYDKESIVEQKSKSISVNSNNKFPSFIPKTDQTRIQSMVHFFDLYRLDSFEETLKLDGSSCTMYKISYKPTLFDRFKRFFGIKYPTYTFKVCSRNMQLDKDDSNFWKVAIKYNIEDKLPIGYALQGELIAPNIQRNHEKVSEAEYYVFDIYNITEQRYLLSSERINMCKELNIPHVPIVNEKVQIFKEALTIEDLLKRVDGESMNKNTISEGRVYKHTQNPNISFKCINNKYLLKED